jgi:CubicO group peptidase (beta-lactamase class C family)
MKSVLLPVLAAALSSAQPAPDLKAQLAQHVEAYVKQRQFAGAVLVAMKGEILLKQGYGLANVEHDVPNRPHTKFRLGSITKQFTATAILQLQEAGKLSVQDPMCQYIAECPAAWQKITVHQLLNHTSGIPSYTNSPDYVKQMRESTTPTDFMKRFKDKPLEFAPGEKYRYNNSGYFLLGMIIEKVRARSTRITCARRSSAPPTWRTPATTGITPCSRIAPPATNAAPKACATPRISTWASLSPPAHSIRPSRTSTAGTAH